MTYAVTGTPRQGTPALIVAYNSGGTVVGETEGSGAPNEYTVSVAVIVPQSAGTPLYVVVSVGSAYVQSTPTPCSGGGSGGPVSNPPAWSGYGDGRLNPNPAEYYSVWCKYDQIEVWRAVPQSILVGKISLAALIGLGNQGTFNAANGLTVVRNNDSVTISGSNGNKAPQAGSKSFSLQDCVNHNGGAPPALPRPPAAAVAATATQTPTATATFDPCAPLDWSSPTPTGTPVGPASVACFAIAHPCVWEPESLDCKDSYPCRIDSNSWDCRGWQTAECLGCWLVTAPPLLIPFILKLWSRRKGGRSRAILKGDTHFDVISQDTSL